MRLIPGNEKCQVIGMFRVLIYITEYVSDILSNQHSMIFCLITHLYNNTYQFSP